MKVAIYSLTRDRLEYTKKCFKQLQEKAWYPYDHFIVDNGSTDGTKEWLKENEDQFAGVIYNDHNRGISYSSNQALEMIGDKYDLIIKFDNDCYVISDNILGQIVEVYEDISEFNSTYILSPKVEGLMNPIPRRSYEMLSGRRIGLVGQVGGIFMCVPYKIHKSFTYPLNFTLARGQDTSICSWFNAQGGKIGYIEGLKVEHLDTTEGQAKKYPEYFKRKFQEEKITYEEAQGLQS